MNVDIDRLRKVASQIKTPLLTWNTQSTSKFLHLTVTGPMASLGFAPLLDGAAGQWRVYLRDLSLRVLKFGYQLTASADDFENVDSSSVQLKGAVALSCNFPAR